MISARQSTTNRGNTRGYWSRLCQAFWRNPRIVQAIATHHDDGRNNTLLGFSPGGGYAVAQTGRAQRNAGNLRQRLEGLEKIAHSLTGLINALLFKQAENSHPCGKWKNFREWRHDVVQGYYQENRKRAYLSGADKSDCDQGNPWFPTLRKKHLSATVGVLMGQAAGFNKRNKIFPVSGRVKINEKLFIGRHSGQPPAHAVRELLPPLIAKRKFDFVIAIVKCCRRIRRNQKIWKNLYSYHIDVLTSGKSYLE